MIGQDDPTGAAASPDGSVPPSAAPFGGWRPRVDIAPALGGGPGQDFGSGEKASGMVAGTEARDPARMWSIAGSWPSAGSPPELPSDPAAPGPSPVSGQVPGLDVRPQTPAEPDAEDPLRAALRYRDLLGASDVARARAGRDAHHRRQGSRAQARRSRAAAADIRSRVEGVWAQVAEPLAQYGLTDLDQLRPTESAAGPGSSGSSGRVALTKGGASGPAGGAARGGAGRPGRSGAAVGRRRAGRPLARAGRAQPEAGGGPDGPRGDRTRRRRGVAGGMVAGQDGPVDPRTAPREAYELCLDAMSKAAELRAVTKGAASASAGLMTALASLLSLCVIGLLRVFAHAPGLPCLVGAALVATGLVAAAAGVEVGAKVLARAGVLGAGCAAVAILATFQLAPTGAVAVAGSLVALAAAARFGLGLGAPAEQQPTAGPRAGVSRKG
ncbi:conserved membrane hypothetical protein [Frankia sp. AiPs1]|uniref:hypothetical protein n=1 Tax=Frankia sp. AiPa1 TaxID=573492 RepID=UPI00202B0B99|nr:hypothetical protein [Frankia sp. AiPa1]MCL9761565.1 hypothetical protein [Frankia sp. AiPa1]